MEVLLRQDKSAKVVGTPVVSVKIGDHCYYGLCDMGASASAIPHTLYQETSRLTRAFARLELFCF